MSIALDISPIVEGHLLIIPHAHSPSLAAWTGSHQALVDAQYRVAQALAARFTEPTFLEHGSTTDVQSGACIEHAHLHCVPGDYDFRDQMSQDFGRLLEFDSLPQALRPLRGRSYLLVQRWDQRPYVALTPKGCLTQYLRRLVATAAGREQRWDWVDCLLLPGLLDDTRTHLSRARRLLESHFE